MLSLRPEPYAPPAKWQYRLSRFMLSRAFWVLTRIVLPTLLIAFMFFQIWTSQGFRNLVENTKAGIYERIAYFPIFIVDEIRFENATRLREEEIRALLSFDVGDSYLEIDTNELLRNLSSVDAVGSAQVRYSYNGVMEIVLEPRVPAMIFLQDGVYTTIDATGHRVESLSARSDRAGLFVISGESADKAAAEAAVLIESMKPIAARVRGLVRVGERRWDIVFMTGAKVMLPQDNPLAALQVLLKQQRTNDVLNRNLEAYDLRDMARPVLRLSPAVREQMNQPVGVTGTSA